MCQGVPTRAGDSVAALMHRLIDDGLLVIVDTQHTYTRDLTMTATLFVRNEIKDFDTWKELWDDSADFVAQHGVVASSIHRDVDNPNLIVLVHQFENGDAARAYAEMFGSEAFAEGPVKVGGVVPESMEVWVCEDL